MSRQESPPQSFHQNHSMFNPHPAFIRSEQAFVSWNVNQKLPKVSEASKKYDRKYFDIQKELLRTFNLLHFQNRTEDC